jgi:hypothetical protein
MWLSILLLSTPVVSLTASVGNSNQDCGEFNIQLSRPSIASDIEEHKWLRIYVPMY